MLRRSLSSQAAASLITALTCAASASGSFGPSSNQIEASGRPPRSRAKLRMIRADWMPRAECGAGDRAGDQHRRVVERLRRQVGSGGSGNKFGEFAGDGHRADYRGSVQLSEKARAQLLNGRPSRCIGHGRPVACTPSRVSRAPNAGISRLHTP